jgi:hypothetical protein
LDTWVVASDENSRASQLSLTQTRQRFVRLSERKRFHARVQRDCGSDGHEFVCGAARDVGDGSDGPFFSQNSVRERREVAHMYQRQLRIRQLAIDDMQVRSTDGASVNMKQQLARPRLRNWKIHFPQRLTRLFEYHCFHGSFSAFSR